ncbi:lipopolysaccharide cholinephosphotransferase [Lachnospiraceae bacterium C7]|nr:lipopolysaccharide cholinephosphotransferase [Lachnospiraceae bacterium C7]
MEFSNDFFEDEIRENFLVSSSMKRFWATNLKVLSIIQDICSRHGITYYAGYGTLLGAIRHKGFIPWDDDIDLYMFREEFEHFAEVAREEMPEGYCLKGYGKGYSYNPIKFFANSADIDDYKKRMEANYGCPYIVGIDIFCLDSIPEEKEEKEVLINVYGMVCDAVDSYELYSQNGKLGFYIEKIEEFCDCTIHTADNPKAQLMKLSEQLAGCYKDVETEEVAIMHNFVTDAYKELVFKRAWFRDTIKVPFENINISIPAEYHKVLEKLYGKDYMTPMQNLAGHNYPCYLPQKEYLEKKFKIILE